MSHEHCSAQELLEQAVCVRLGKLQLLVHPRQDQLPHRLILPQEVDLLHRPKLGQEAERSRLPVLPGEEEHRYNI